ncbi:MAG: hypothetical protein V1779_12110 [bacterium]
MNLEELISKYLDGEMSVEEDELLRESLSADAMARLKFDSAVNLHLAMKEDAESIFPPDELLAQTEDMILMKIFAKAPESRKRRAAVWSYVPMLAAAIAFFLFVSVFEISDVNQLIIDNSQLTIGNLADSKQQKADGNQLIIDNSQLTIDNNKLKTQNSKPATDYGQRITGNREPLSENNVIAGSTGGKSGEAGVSGSYFVVNAPVSPVGVSQPDVSEELSMNGQLITDNGQPAIDNGQPATDNGEPITDNGQPAIDNGQPATDNGQRIAGNGKPVMDALSLTALKIENAEVHLLSSNEVIPNKIDIAPFVLKMEIPITNDFTGVSDVQVASFFGSDFARGGIHVNDAVISHFSQSVAYAVNENERFGVEVGYTQYSFIDRGTVNVEHKIGGVSGVEAYEGGYDFSIGYPQDLALNSDKQLLWASAFYENTFFKADGLSLVGRLGFGGTSDGPLGYSRLFAQYSVFNGFYLTFGAEGRMFSAEFSKFIENEDKLKTTASLIYGIQFKF